MDRARGCSSPGVEPSADRRAAERHDRRPRRGSRPGLALAGARAPQADRAAVEPTSSSTTPTTTRAAEAARDPHQGQQHRRARRHACRCASSPARRTSSSPTGNHIKDPDGRYRYQRLAEETTISVLREELANLDSVGFYSTERRLAASAQGARGAQQAARRRCTSRPRPCSSARSASAPSTRSSSRRSSSTSRTSCSTTPAEAVAAEQQKLDNYIQGTAAQVVGPHAGLDQAPGRARARVPGRRARGRGSDAGRGARQAGVADARAAGRGQAPRPRRSSGSTIRRRSARRT